MYKPHKMLILILVLIVIVFVETIIILFFPDISLRIHRSVNPQEEEYSGVVVYPADWNHAESNIVRE